MATKSNVESRARVLGHPLHPILIVFPIGLLVTSLIFDGVYLYSGNGRWADIAYWMIISGIIGGFLAASTGWIDWFAIPTGTRARAIGLVHGVGNFIALVLYAASWYLRRDAPEAPETLAIAISSVSAVLLLFTGWLGGELIHRLNVSIDDGANLNASNSLSGKPASEAADGYRHA